MADAAVEFLLNNLKELLLYHSNLITKTKGEIESLEKDLRLFKAFLKDSVKKRNDGPTKVLVHNIRDVVYEVEDVIDEFVTKAMEKTYSLCHGFWKRPVDLHSIGKKVEGVKVEVERARKELAYLGVDDVDKSEKLEGPQRWIQKFIYVGAEPAEPAPVGAEPSADGYSYEWRKHILWGRLVDGGYGRTHPHPFGSATARPPRQTDVVGFVDVMDELRHCLTKETDYFNVVSLIGMFGLGKTTLAWKIFNDPAIIHKFSIRIWLPISQEFSNKDVFLAILEEFTPITKIMRHKDDQKLARMAADYLEGESFLIVMDDVWNRADWDRLRVALPENNKQGKILITSRNEDVGTYVSCPRRPHKLRLFTPEESWELLRLEALRKLECPSELENIGKLIAGDCGGLPLAIVVIGGILAAKYSATDISVTRKAWKEVSTRVITYVNENDPADRMKRFISLSYDGLPYHLRACFLYLAAFPEDYEIPVSRLIRMWIGEGFIQQSNDYNVEETAEKYLEDLINRNLIRIEKFKPNGKVKTCRIHDTLREFCQTEAANDNENFLQEIKFKNGVFVPRDNELHKYRRLSIHSNCLDFFSSEPFGRRIRSFVCFSKDGFTLPAENIPHILGAFKLLRVLDVKPIQLTKITNHMYQLVHMRYISLSLDTSTLPSKFSLLWNIQTLIVDTTSRTLIVIADIWKLTRLRHFKTNAIATLPEPSKSSNHGAELQTLGTISAESCTAEILDQACNLKKLSIRGRLALLLEGKIGSLESLGRTTYLEKLKLANDVYPRPPSEGQLCSLPQPYQFPSKLRSLTLVATFLSWDCMSVLGLLYNLEVLKLKAKAFMGRTWKAIDGGFRSLEFLQIEETDLAVWEASSHHFPRLRGLVLKNCDKLLEIPIGLADVKSLQMLELYICKSAAASANEIKEAKKRTQVEGSAFFKLSIFPPTES